MLEIQEVFLGIQGAGITGKCAVSSYDTVAWRKNRKGIRAVGIRYSSHSRIGTACPYTT